jgi:hypothetical protein
MPSNMQMAVGWQAPGRKRAKEAAVVKGKWPSRMQMAEKNNKARRAKCDADGRWLAGSRKEKGKKKRL